METVPSSNIILAGCGLKPTADLAFGYLLFSKVFCQYIAEICAKSCVSQHNNYKLLCECEICPCTYNILLCSCVMEIVLNLKFINIRFFFYTMWLTCIKCCDLCCTLHKISFCVKMKRYFLFCFAHTSGCFLLKVFTVTVTSTRLTGVRNSWPLLKTVESWVKLSRWH